MEHSYLYIVIPAHNSVKKFKNVPTIIQVSLFLKSISNTAFLEPEEGKDYSVNLCRLCVFKERVPLQEF